MRILTEYELDLVAGGTASSDFYPDGSGGFENGGGFDTPSYGGGNGGHWVWIPTYVSVQVGDYPPSAGWNGYWAYFPNDYSGGYPGGGSGQGAGPNGIDLGGHDCPTEQSAARDSLEALYNGSPTARDLINTAAVNGVDIQLITASLSGYGAQAQYSDGIITWDPYLYFTGVNSDGSNYTTTPIMILAHELIHAGHPNELQYQGSASEALVMQIANQIAAEMNASTGSNYDTSRDNHDSQYRYYSSSSSSASYTIARPGCG